MLRSQSVPGMSSIVLVFDSDADLYRSRALVQERLAQMGAAAMPNVSKPPVMLQPYSSSSRLLMLISSEEVSPIEKSVIARWTIQPPARRSRCRERGHLGLPGPPAAGSGGSGAAGSERHHAAAGRRDRRERDLLAAELRRGLYAGHRRVIELQRLGVRHVFDRLTDPGGWAVMGTGGGGLRLTDVTTVVVDHQPLIGDAIVNDPTASSSWSKVPGERSRSPRASRRRSPISGPASVAWNGTSIFPGRRPSRTRSTNHWRSLIAGVLLAVISILLARSSELTVLIGLITIPLSLVAAALVLDVLGETF